MRTEIEKIKIDKTKKNIVVIGDCYELTDILEIYLYKRYNVIPAINEFDGLDKIGHFEPSAILMKGTSNTNTILSFIPKIEARHSRDIPIIIYTKEDITSITEFAVKAGGIREVVKFPIGYKDFWTIMQLCITD